MKLTKDTYMAEDIIKIVCGNNNVTVDKKVLEQWLKSNIRELKVGR